MKENSTNLVEENKKTYDMNIWCRNCRHRTLFQIPFGVYAKEYLGSKKLTCEKCGCALITG
jgi:ribosomal protein S27E